MNRITKKQGDTIRRSVKLKYAGTGNPVNLTGCEAFAQMRKTPGGDLAASAACLIDAALGRITVTFTGAQTAALDPGVYGYDIRLSSEGDTVTLYEEQVSIVLPYTEIEE